MELAYRNSIHEKVEISLRELGVKNHALYFEEHDDKLIVTIYFKRGGRGIHRIDIWCNELASTAEITAALVDGFEAEGHNSDE